MLEKSIEQYLRDEVRKIGGRAYKFVSPGNDGVPDRLVCLPGGRALFVETKATGEKATDQQLLQQKRLIDLGFIVFNNIDSKDWVNCVIECCKLPDIKYS
jgi:hypothetical protein